METTLQLTNTEILQIIADYFEIEPKVILSKNKMREVADARFIYYKLLREKGFTLKHIGKICGDRQHAAIINGIRMVTNISTIQTNYQNIKNKII